MTKFTLTGAVLPGLIDANGGAAVTIDGTFDPAGAYRVFAAANTQGPPCYSGVSGQGSICYPRNGSTIRARIPVVAPGPVTLTVQDVATQQALTVGATILAQAAFLCAQVFALRQNVRPILATGPTEPSQVPEPMPVPGFKP